MINLYSLGLLSFTAWKVCKYGVFSGVFLFEHFSHIDYLRLSRINIQWWKASFNTGWHTFVVGLLCSLSMRGKILTSLVTNTANAWKANIDFWCLISNCCHTDKACLFNCCAYFCSHALTVFGSCGKNLLISRKLFRWLSCFPL